MDGIFAPLFWMFLGTILWEFNQSLPGPLAMAWIFKASSTIDSMLGYKKGKLKWLGFTGAKLDDLMVWIPSRIVLITLPFCCKTKQSIFKTIKIAWKDGIVDSSPNSGISEAIFAYCAEVKMGGVNYYKREKRIKPIIAEKKNLTEEINKKQKKVEIQGDLTGLDDVNKEKDTSSPKNDKETEEKEDLEIPSFLRNQSN